MVAGFTQPQRAESSLSDPSGKLSKKDCALMATFCKKKTKPQSAATLIRAVVVAKKKGFAGGFLHAPVRYQGRVRSTPEAAVYPEG
jgi:hypothetical protein